MISSYRKPVFQRTAMTPDVLTHPDAIQALSAQGVLTPEFLKDLREGYVMGREDRALHNAVTNNSINALALNRDAVRGEDGHYSHRIKREGVADQKQSGRCWMFAGLNTLLPQMMREHKMESFEFSTAYLQFWDKMEKSNLYFESVIELRGADFMDRDWELVNKHSPEEGGWWNFLTALVDKYGVAPLSAMPETKSSSDTKSQRDSRTSPAPPCCADHGPSRGWSRSGGSASGEGLCPQGGLPFPRDQPGRAACGVRVALPAPQEPGQNAGGR